MLAIQEAQQLLQQAHFQQINAVYTSNIPSTVDTDKTVALITDVATRPDEYGNNHLISITHQIELQIFYELAPEYDVEQLEINILQLFDNNGWQINESHGHTVDPDTLQMTATFYFTKYKNI